MLQAKIASLRSTCNSRPQGAVLVRDHRVVAGGYNGALSGQEHCLGKFMDEVECPECSGNTMVWDQNEEPPLDVMTCPRCQGRGTIWIPYCHRRATNTPDSQKDRACRSAHAEANALAMAARFGISVQGCICYCTTRPCPVCQKLLFQAGIVEVVYELDYDEPDGYVDVLPCRELRLSARTIDQAVATIRGLTSKRRLERTR